MNLYWPAMILVSLVGLVIFNYGRKQREFAFKACGIAMMIIPYFIHQWLLLLGISGLLCYLTWKFHD